MTKEEYLQIRDFVLKTHWNQLYDSWGGAYADKSIMRQHILAAVTSMDKILGNTPHRNSVTLTVDIIEPKVRGNIPASPISLLQSLWSKIHAPKLSMIQDVDGPIQPEDTAHSWRNNLSHFAFKSTLSGLELLGSVVHEGEHANQSDISCYTSDERKLIAIFRSINCSPEENFSRYQMNPNEMAARIKEAKVYLEVFEHAQQDPDWNMQEREFFLQKFKELNQRLTACIGEKEIDRFVDDVVKGLQMTSESCDIINQTFNGTSSHKCNVAAAQFMNITGRKLHQQLCTTLLQYSAELSKVIRQLDRETNPALERNVTEQRDQRNSKLRRFYDAGIQMIDAAKASPFPQGCINLEYSNNVEYAIQIARMYYNPAIIQMRDGLCMIYDTQPCVRPYSPPSETREKFLPQINESMRCAQNVEILETNEPDKFDEP